jgi:acetylornithine deacetylase/succinyl-diaminopimelate desuccinylase-like protein
MIQLLKQLVKINSIFPNEYLLSTYIRNYLETIGFKIQVVKTSVKRVNIIATYGMAKKYLAFYGHMDTVAPETGYPQNPFKLIIKKNKAYGLGVADMKGGITAIIKLGEFAAKNKLPVKLIFGVDEENISQGAHDLVNSNLLSTIDFMIVAESGQIKNKKQPISVCYGRKGRIIFDINVYGKRSHAAESKRGINALEQASKLILEIKKMTLPKDTFFGTSDVVFQRIISDIDSFSIPDLCLIQCSLLTNSKCKGVDFIKQVQSIALKNKIKIAIKFHERTTPYGESYIVDLKNPFMKKIINTIIKPKQIKPIYTDSVADENVFANRLKIPVLTMGAIGGGDHTKSEWLSIPSLKELFESYKIILHLYNRNI